MGFKYLYFSLCHKVWRKTSIYLPLWRQEMQRQNSEIQGKLDWFHTIRDTVNKMYNNDVTTRAALKIFKERDTNTCIINKKLIEKIREIRKN